MYELRHDHPVRQLVKVAGLARSTYYHLTQKREQPDTDHALKQVIISIYHQHKGRYGYRRVRDELYNQGYVVNHKKVYRLMKGLGLKSLVRMKKYKSYRGRVGKAAENILSRNFRAERPNQKWVTDITEFKLFGQKLYLSPILDLFNGEIITYTIGSRPTYSLVEEMLNRALPRLEEDDELLLHSDQGWHYQMPQYRKTLKDYHITQSMSRKGNCHDNAVMENFFGIMKSEFLYLNEFESIEQFKQALKSYIYYYNHVRIKARLRGKSPVIYRKDAIKAA